MVEKERIDVNDSEVSELSSPEELDLDDQIEIISDEKDTVEPLEVLQEEIVNEKEENESGKPDNDTLDEVEVLANPDDGESELSPSETEAENISETADEQKNGQLNLDEFDDDIDLFLDEIEAIQNSGTREE